MATAADVLLEALIDWKVDTIFGLPGDGINGIVEALRKRQKAIRFIQVRHEQSAAFMATAYAKWTGKLGVCLATSGPGGTNLLTGLYDAKLDQVPVLAITGMQFHDLAETFTQQDVNLTRVFEDVSVYNTIVSDAAHMENAASLACRTAMARRGVAHISIANDTQEKPAEQGRSRRNLPKHVPNEWFSYKPHPSDELIEQAASMLNGANRVAILAGRGALEAREELRRTAELLAAPVAKALLGKAIMDDDDPYTTGGIGILGTAPSQDIMKSCDALLIIGSTFPYIEYYPDPQSVKAVQIDFDPQRIGLRHPVQCGLVGDARAVLSRLNSLLEAKTEGSFLKDVQEKMQAWRTQMAALTSERSSPLKPQPVVYAFGRRIDATGILVTDSGQNTELAARHADLKTTNAFAVSGGLASMASGLPYAIAAGLACPGRNLYAVVGDGGLAMQLGEFSTAVRYKLPLKILVVCNGMLNQIAWEQMMFLGHPQFACELAPIDFAMAAEAMGGRGFTISSFDEMERVFDEAFAVDGPVIVQANVDKYEPMMPPKMPKDYAANLKKALPGTPGHEEIEQNIAREPLASMMNASIDDPEVDENSGSLPGIP